MVIYYGCNGKLTEILTLKRPNEKQLKEVELMQRRTKQKSLITLLRKTMIFMRDK